MSRNDALSSLRQVLLKRRDALRKALAGDLSSLQEINGGNASSDVLDAALDASHDEICSQLAEVESRELSSINRALEKMREGTFGSCEGCGQAIPTARLQALPYATTCIKCKRAVEEGREIGEGAADWGRIIDTTVAENDVQLSDLEMDVS